MTKEIQSIFCWTALTACCWSQNAASHEPLAVVAGQPIYEADLPVFGQMLQLRKQEYDIKRRALDELIERRLLEAEARKRGVATDQLIANEVDAKIGEPTDSEVEAYYLARPADQARPFAEVKTQLRQALKQVKVTRARHEFTKSLREGSVVTVLLDPPRVEVAQDPRRLKGPSDAPVRIVEFSDYECPYCSQAQSTLKSLLAKYEGKVSLGFRDFPLVQLHPRAQVAAEASRCAAEQGRFWEYHDLLFANSPNFSQPKLLEYASGAGLNTRAFESCLSTGKHRQVINQDIEDGKMAGVTGTPAFFVNGVLLSGAQPVSAFDKIIEEELARKNATRAPR